MFTKLVRLGIDSELKSTQSGKKLLIVTAVYNVGYGDNQKPQWCELVLWGNRAESMEQHFKKGTQLCVTLDDLESEGYPSQRSENGVGSKIKAKIVDFEFAGSRQNNNQGAQYGNNNTQQNNFQQAPQSPQQQAPQTAPGGFDDFDDPDIPF